MVYRVRLSSFPCLLLRLLLLLCCWLSRYLRGRLPLLLLLLPLWVRFSWLSGAMCCRWCLRPIRNPMLPIPYLLCCWLLPYSPISYWLLSSSLSTTRKCRLTNMRHSGHPTISTTQSAWLLEYLLYFSAADSSVSYTPAYSTPSTYHSPTATDQTYSQ